ncbi:DUF2127 domain-containing protein [Yersinia intermedia]|jgi:uncharacterized membrane protein|uniref:DUF2127 domain-containing protein n=1 Tax=Yersinia intermedia TaxID=631 RepID=A0A209A331_YERIN|nr:DUF2127 domain-containing protein [Yersinia intermedia]MCB5322163.1 DUF2127 domain-containing protein [Yersinia intermedia]OVZ87129.1 hypothetical protein CBW57_10080 [Yersinia intermedia]UNK24589.1 DUF2127 domain-containing protein [Yersinia intermedia]UZM72179.1 DUF2127 domain-containing protein [Yersinia intermedia]WET14393.1 DUF2127 domain-containing protein [Yersinia intermedia]
MLNMRNRFDDNHIFGEKNIHAVFELSLLLKAILAMMEIIAGILTYFVTPKFLLDILHRITQVEFIEDRGDMVANYLLHAAQNLSISSLHFAAFYLLIHGVVKLWVIIGLWRKKLGYYPAAITIFSLFIIYQLYRYTFTHSVLLILITALDAVVIALTLLEYRRLRHQHTAPSKPY